MLIRGLLASAKTSDALGAIVCTQKAVHLSDQPRRYAEMPRLKDETLSIRTSAEVKQLLRMAAEREHRSTASMMEVLILTYAQAHGLKLDSAPATTTIRK